MESEILSALGGAGLGGLVKLGWDRRLTNGRSRGNMLGDPYVRLSPEDSSRLEKVTNLLEQLVGLEVKTQGALEKLGEALTAGRLEQAEHHGEILGRIGGRG